MAKPDSQLLESLFNQIEKTDDADQTKELVGKLKDMLTMNATVSPDEKNKELVKRWSKKIEPIDHLMSDNDILCVAHLLEKQYEHLSQNVNVQEYNDKVKEITQLENQLFSLSPEAQVILGEAIENKKKNLPMQFKNTMAWRGVNVLDEVVKMYDLLTCKEFVSIQPMGGPVGLAYAMRFRNSGPISKREISKIELVEEHNRFASFSSGKISPIDKFEDLTEQELKKYQKEYIILGYDKEQEQWIEPDVGLTVEQKEVVAKTRKMKLAKGEKVSANQVASEIDRELIHTVKKVATKKIVTKRKLTEEIINASDEIGQRNKMGSGNIIICNLSKTEIPNAILDAKIEDTSVPRFKIIDNPYLKTNEILIAYKGKRAGDAGVIYCPYICFAPQNVIGNDPYASTNVMTRYGVCDNISGSDNYYQLLEVKDVKQSHIDQYYTFRENCKAENTKENIEKFQNHLNSIWIELTDNFQNPMEIAQGTEGLCEYSLTTRWSVEASQDLKSIHNIDLEAEMGDLLAMEASKEIKELKGKLHSIIFNTNNGMRLTALYRESK